MSATNDVIRPESVVYVGATKDHAHSSWSRSVQHVDCQSFLVRHTADYEHYHILRPTPPPPPPSSSSSSSSALSSTAVAAAVLLQRCQCQLWIYIANKRKASNALVVIITRAVNVIFPEISGKY